jgi:hypothetical protein
MKGDELCFTIRPGDSYLESTKSGLYLRTYFCNTTSLYLLENTLEIGGGLYHEKNCPAFGLFSAVHKAPQRAATERVKGKLRGCTGSFVLQHSGTMTRGELELVVSVVPDSGTGELKSVSGKMQIDIIESKHFYTFDYVINDA